LEDIHDEMLIPAAIRNFLGGRDDRFGALRVQEPKLLVDLGAGQLDLGERFDEATIEAELGSWLMGKLSTARWVDAPHRASEGTAISPMESRSTRLPG
jgi:hypothetical protein